MSVQHSVLNVKALVCAFNQEKALVDAFSVIVKNLWESSYNLRFKLYCVPVTAASFPRHILAAAALECKCHICIFRSQHLSASSLSSEYSGPTSALISTYYLTPSDTTSVWWLVIINVVILVSRSMSSRWHYFSILQLTLDVHKCMSSEGSSRSFDYEWKNVPLSLFWV